jgi:hypothetical protein
MGMVVVVLLGTRCMGMVVEPKRRGWGEVPGCVRVGVRRLRTMKKLAHGRSSSWCTVGVCGHVPNQWRQGSDFPTQRTNRRCLFLLLRIFCANGAATCIFKLRQYSRLSSSRAGYRPEVAVVAFNQWTTFSCWWLCWWPCAPPSHSITFISHPRRMKGPNGHQ